jgi:hypothetical protein
MMDDWQFHTNWIGLIVLQRKHTYRDQFGDMVVEFENATTHDLKDYYQDLYNLQGANSGQTKS